MPKPRIIALSGSLRAGSFNKKLVNLAADAARSSGAEVTVVDPKDLDLPLFNEDLEKDCGLPEPARRLKHLMVESDGFLIASPEYNSSVTAALKNAIDWVSRVESKDEPPLAAFRGKAAAVMSASPGALGGLRGLVHLRAILGNIGVLVLTDQVCISSSHEAFDEKGRLKDRTKQQQVTDLGRKLAAFLARQTG